MIKPRVLVVDDEETIRKLLKGRLEREGQDVAIAGNAEEASIIERRIIPKSTLARRAGSGTLTREESEKTERLARLFAQATESLGSEDEARLFLRRPHPELEGRVPLEAAIT